MPLPLMQRMRNDPCLANPQSAIRLRQVLPVGIDKLRFVLFRQWRQFQGHSTTVPRLIERRRHHERVAVMEGRAIKDFVQPFEQVITGRMLHHQMAAGRDVNAVIGVGQHRGRGCVTMGRRGHGRRCSRRGWCRRGAGDLVEMHMDMDGGRGCSGGRRRHRLWRPNWRLSLLLWYALPCSVGDVAGEPAEQEYDHRHHRAR